MTKECGKRKGGSLEKRKKKEKKNDQERIIVEQLRKLDERRREEEEKLIEGTNKIRDDKLKMKFEEKKVNSYDLFVEEWREIERIKEEQRREDEQLIREEKETKERLGRGEIVEEVTNEPGDGLVLSPVKLTLVSK
uniref:Uncharacterized protein n=1 Tax=Cuerna arida TaxID=1464854 RepID=A0A1B6ENY7_9HEMI